MKKRVVLALAVLMSPALGHASPDLFAGKWTLEVRNSIYPAGTCPKSMTIEIKQVDSGVWYQSIATYKNRSEEHTSELQSHSDLVCRLLLEKKKKHARS